MSSGVGRDDVDGFTGVNPKRLSAGSCFGIGASAMTFVAISAVMGPLKEHFLLTNEQVGWIGGAAMWGFTVTILTFGSLCDVVGMRLVLRLAILAHVGGALLMIFATGMVVVGLVTVPMMGRVADSHLNEKLPVEETRACLETVVEDYPAAPKSAAADSAKELLGPAENYGGRISFRRVALLSILLTLIFGVLYLRDRARGGYRAEKLSSKEAV